MSKIGNFLFKAMLTVGFATLCASLITAREKPALGSAGRDIYIDRCGACHGEDGTGNGPAVGMLKIAPPDLTLLAQRNGGTFPTERVKDIVGGWAGLTAHGSREMPVWGDLFSAKKPVDQKVANDRFKSLVSFLESIQQ